LKEQFVFVANFVTVTKCSHSNNNVKMLLCVVFTLMLVVFANCYVNAVVTLFSMPALPKEKFVIKFFNCNK